MGSFDEDLAFDWKVSFTKTNSRSHVGSSAHCFLFFELSFFSACFFFFFTTGDRLVSVVVVAISDDKVVVLPAFGYSKTTGQNPTSYEGMVYTSSSLNSSLNLFQGNRGVHINLGCSTHVNLGRLTGLKF